MRHLTTYSACIVLAFAALSGCGDDDGSAGTGGSGGSGGSAGSGGTGGGDSGVADSGAGTGGSTMDSGTVTYMPDAGTVTCGDALCVCNNGKDDDGDGLIDGADPECTGALDDDEGTFATGIPGDNQDPNCQDCFFDGNSGSGDDKCRYATSCLTDGTASSGSGSCGTCEVSQDCIDFCQPAAPNGCDCFGCCEVQNGNETVYVTLGGECSLADIDDETVCPRCHQSDQCLNECGRCELCAGKTLDDLPADCGSTSQPDGGVTGDAGTGEDPPSYTCENGTPCDGDNPCPTGEYCQLGCCLPILF